MPDICITTFKTWWASYPATQKTVSIASSREHVLRTRGTITVCRCSVFLGKCDKLFSQVVYTGQ